MDRKAFKLFMAGVFSLGLFLASSKNVLADWRCETVYGGGEKCYGTGELFIDKTVKNPDTDIFVNNLGINDPKFGPEAYVRFRLEVKNIGQSELRDVKVRDVFPPYLQFDWFSLGSSYWDANKREVNFTIEKLAVGESKQYEISAKVYPSSMLPNDKSEICDLTNFAEVHTGDKGDDDTAKFCLTYKTLGLKKMPATGMPLGIEFAGGLLLLSLIGAKLAFRKEA